MLQVNCSYTMQSGGLEASHATQCEPESSRHQVKRSLEACVASADSQRAGKAHKAAASGCSGAGMVDVTKLERANLERAYLDLNVQVILLLSVLFCFRFTCCLASTVSNHPG